MNKMTDWVDRRGFLWAAAAGVYGAASGYAAVPKFPTNPFTLGVASGDPLPDSVVLWTRLAPDPLNAAALPAHDIPVRWEVYEDEQGRRRVQSGVAIAPASLAHSIHAEVRGLMPDRWYWYRFIAGGEESALARTRTAPAMSAARPFRFAFVSCQNFEHGYFTAFDHLAKEDICFVAHLGDYIYEKGANNNPAFPRRHPKEMAVTLDQYRLRYAWYKRDQALQKAHAAFPWIVTPDDHEVSNNYAGDSDEYGTSLGKFLKWRAAAYQAYYEHMPLRSDALPHLASMRLYRRLQFGSLALFHVLDTRQYRSHQPCGDGVKPVCAGALAAGQTMMGTAQEEWLEAGFEHSGATWNVLAQQVLMAEVNWNANHQPVLENMDKWDGYHADRQRLFEMIERRKPLNPIVITGDIHSSWVNDLKADFRDSRSPVIATEFAGTSISSGGDRPDKHGDSSKWLPNNPHVKFYNHQRGYVVCDITAGRWRSDFRMLDYVTREGSPISTGASFVVETNRAGAMRTSS